MRSPADSVLNCGEPGEQGFSVGEPEQGQGLSLGRPCGSWSKLWRLREKAPLVSERAPKRQEAGQLGPGLALTL